MPTATPAAQVLRFDRFELQPAERRLLADGRDAGLGGRALDVLLALVTRAGHLVSRHELLDLAWPGLVVEENNLSVQISALRKVLGGEIIATVPGRGYRFAAPLGDAANSPTASSPAGASAATAPAQQPAASTRPAPPSPPSAPRLIGRDEDLAQLASASQRPGLVTLTGPSGVGKTSLALAFAAASAAGTATAAGAVWVDLAALNSGSQLEAAVARALGLSTPDSDAAGVLARGLGARLLVLDNAEHLVDAAAVLVAALRQAAPGCRLLVTSQLPLTVPGEQVLRIGPLALPGEASDADDRGDAADRAQAVAQGAVALFIERARAADHRFTLPAAAWPAVRAICRGLDGLPLALEMAAARVPALGLSGVHDALGQRFALLTSGYRHAAGRHRTLHAALDWSHDLLAPDEQRVFRACGVFAGGFTLELAVAVAATVDTEALGATATTAAGAAVLPPQRWSVIDALAGLVDRSLIAADLQDPPRYRLLETMRAYALEKLVASGEEPPRRQRLAWAMAALFAAAAAPGASAAERALALAEHDNARDAIAWAVRHDPALAVQLAPDVCAAASYVSWRREAFEWLESCATVVDDARVSAVQRAVWWNERARQQVISVHSQARSTARHARDLWLALGDEMRVFNAMAALVRAGHQADDDLHRACDEMQALLERHPEWPLRCALSLAGARAWACTQQGDWHGVLRYRLEEAELAGRAQNQSLADAAETNIVDAMRRLKRFDEALARNTALLARIGETNSINTAYAWLTRIALLVELGRFADVRAAVPQASDVLQRFDVPDLTLALALMAALEGRPRSAARLLGSHRQALTSRGRPLLAEDQPELARIVTLVRSSLDETTVDALLGAGAALNEAQALRLACASDDSP